MPALDEAPASDAPAGKLPLFHIVGFTGHRHMTDPAGAARAIRDALDALRREVPGEWIALSSDRGGSDQLFVRQARAGHVVACHPAACCARNSPSDFTPEDWAAVEAHAGRGGPPAHRSTRTATARTATWTAASRP